MDMKEVKVGDEVIVEMAGAWIRRVVTKVARTYFYIGSHAYSRDSGWLHRPLSVETRWAWTPEGFVQEIEKESGKPFQNVEMWRRDAVRAFRRGGRDAVLALKSGIP